MEPVAFTPVAPDDTDALRDLFTRVRGHDFDAFRRGCAERWPSATTHFLTQGGNRAGWAIVDRSPRGIHVIDIAVLPERRGAGIGTGALRALQDEASRDGRTMTLAVERANLPAMRLYSRLGFEASGADETYLQLEWRPAPAAPVTAAAMSAASFRPALDTWFELIPSAPPLLLPLREINERAPSGGFARFSLIFHGPGDRALEQGMYTLRHSLLGDHDLFLVPVSDSTPARMVYEACFTIPQTRQAP